MSSPNTNALTYNGYVQQIAAMAVYQTAVNDDSVTVGVDAAFNTIIPQMLAYSEMRIQKDLDLQASQIANTNYALTAGTNTVSLSSNDFQTIQTIAYTSGTATSPILPASKEFIQYTYNDSAAANQGPPAYFATYGGDTSTGGNTSNNLLFGPYPDQSYALTITGTQWLPSLYATSTPGNGSGTTYISTNYPDLLIQASMVFLTEYQRNFGPASNDPQMGVTYESTYKTLLASAMELENRKKFRDAAWSSQSQSPVATPTR